MAEGDREMLGESLRAGFISITSREITTGVIEESDTSGMSRQISIKIECVYNLCFLFIWFAKDILSLASVTI